MRFSKGDSPETVPVRMMKAAEDYQFDFTGEQATIKSLAGSSNT